LMVSVSFLNAPSAKDALVRIVAIEGIGHIHFVGLGFVRNLLMFHMKHLCRVMHGAVAVAVVAHCAIKHMISEDAVKGLALRCVRAR
jgi:hypothetical protein